MDRLTRLRTGLDAVAGFQTAAVASGIKPSGKPDLALIVADEPAFAAGCFTRNQAAAPPVLLCRRHLRGATQRAIVINAGVANCATGSRGVADAQHMAEDVAEHLGCRPREVLVCSTGVIGEPLPMDRVEAGIAAAAGMLGSRGRYRAAEAILTTDTVIKERAYRHAEGWTVAGMSKGSGMIHPNMATMMAFVLTDALVSRDDLRRIARRAVQHSFNRISVDNDESTNDTCLVLASGASGRKLASNAALARFEAALTRLCQELAQDIVRDGEGASTFIAVQVRGARSEREADRVASAICDSMLVKTAFAGRDPNWGRIVAAAGYSGVRFQLDRLRVLLNGVVIFSEGTGHNDRTRPYRRESNGAKVTRRALAKRMHRGDQEVVVELGQGRCEATRWTSDLTHGYVTINADYTT